MWEAWEEGLPLTGVSMGEDQPGDGGAGHCDWSRRWQDHGWGLYPKKYLRPGGRIIPAVFLPS